MVKRNRYRDIIESGDVGPLSKIFDREKCFIERIVEYEKIRIFMKFIVYVLKGREISVENLVREFCLLEKALAGKIGGCYIITKGGGRYNAMPSYDHYRIRLFRGFRKLGMEFDEKRVLTSEELDRLSGIVWD